MPDRDHILTLSCPDRRGIVAAVASFLNGQACNIIEGNVDFFIAVKQNCLGFSYVENISPRATNTTTACPSQHKHPKAD